MNIGDVAHERLRIALNAVEKDGSIPANIRMGFKTLYQCLYEQKLSIQTIQSQINQKINSNELSYMLSQKLSINEFIKYFEKIQKIVDGVQTHANNSEQRIQKKIDSRFSNIQQLFNSHPHFTQIQMKDIQNIKKQIINIKQELNHIKFGALKQIKGKQNINQVSPKVVQKAQILMDSQLIIKELKKIELYSAQNKINIQNLVQKNYVTFQQIRQLLQNLQYSIQKSIKKVIVENPQPSYSGQSMKVLWNSQQGFGRANFNLVNSYSQILQLDQTNTRIHVLKPGIYQITCILFPHSETQITIKMNSNIIAKHMCSDIPKHNLARNIMLSIKIQQQNDIMIVCKSTEPSQGALSFLRF